MLVGVLDNGYMDRNCSLNAKMIVTLLSTLLLSSLLLYIPYIFNNTSTRSSEFYCGLWECY